MIFGIVFVSISALFAILLHFMAKRRNLNPVFWGAWGAIFWFFPIPCLLWSGRSGDQRTDGLQADSGNGT